MRKCLIKYYDLIRAAVVIACVLFINVRAEARTACKDSSLACICFGTKLNLNEFATVACFVVCAVGDVLVHAQARKKKPKQKG